MKLSLAILAVLFVMLRPVCDALAAGSVHMDGALEMQVAALEGAGDADARASVPCCANLENGTLAHSSAPAAIQLAGAGKLAPAARGWILVDPVAISESDLRHPPDTIHTRHSYYARSARIQR